MKRGPFKPWTGSTLSRRFRPAGPSATASNTVRHGILSLYAALDVRTGQVVGKTPSRHTSAEFVAFLAVSTCR
jgi:hypothetical protein